MSTPDLTKPNPIITKPTAAPKFEAPIRGGSIPMKGPYVEPNKAEPVKVGSSKQPAKAEPSKVEPPSYPQPVEEPKTGHVTETAKK